MKDITKFAILITAFTFSGVKSFFEVSNPNDFATSHAGPNSLAFWKCFVLLEYLMNSVLIDSPFDFALLTVFVVGLSLWEVLAAVCVG